MRFVLLIFLTGAFFSAKAQTVLPVGALMYSPWQPFSPYSLSHDSNRLNNKWYLSSYTGISAGFGFYNGGNASFLSVPVGLQLNRQLNNNLVAFAGISGAPTLMTFNHSFMDPSINKSYPAGLPNTYQFGMSSRVELGLMYINDAKTFSISGSIGIERSSFPVYYPPIPTNSKRQ